jgi:transposase
MQVTVTVLLPGPVPGEPVAQVKQFRTFYQQLCKMAAWLVGLGVTDVAMESTGVYWWPVYHALKQTRSIEVCVCNAAHMHNVPGRKTDITDSRWIAELHRFGLLRASFIPTEATAALRTRTRYRKKLIGERASEGQRLTKVLEDAGIKIDSVASKLLCVSGRDMIEAMIAGQRDPLVLAGLARGVLRRKTEELAMACDGRFTQQHAEMCRVHLDAYDYYTAQIAQMDQQVVAAAEPFTAVIARLATIPGIGPRIAQVIVAETGGDMSRFASPGHLAAWAGVAPGNRESAGKRMRTGARKGNTHLRAALVQAAWATSRTRTRPGVRMRRLLRRFGRGNEQRAAVAVAHTLLAIAWAVMARGRDYVDAGADYYDQRDRRNRDHIVKRYQQALARLGYQVTIQPLDPPPGGTPPLTASAA